MTDSNVSNSKAANSIAANKATVHHRTMEHHSAMEHDLALCHSCKKLSKMPEDSHHKDVRCPVCDTPLHFRKEKSLSRTWALVITGIILTIPANVYPIMSVIMFGSESTDTIISGIITLAEFGMYAIAFIVFMASIFVPGLKLVAMLLLLLTVQANWKLSSRQCTMLYRMVHFIGRWSMLDLFVISVLATLVDLGNIATITGGPGATAFGAVVVVTMFAANTFDTRLIWDMKDGRK